MTEPEYRITVVCTGNICRSPMGEFVLRELLDEAGVGDRVVVDSAGTTAWEEGNPADPRTLAVLARNGHPDLGGGAHLARRIEAAWLDEVDLVLAADRGHLHELQRIAPSPEARERIQLFRSFDPDAAAAGDLEMDDPWFGDDSAFDRTYAEVVAAARGVVEHVLGELRGRRAV